MNLYVHDPTRSRQVVFTSEAIENTPAGWRARETYLARGAELYSRARLKPAR